MADVSSPRTGASPAAQRPVNLVRVVSLLGIAQIISWGSLYYSLTILAAPIQQELGFSELMIFGAFSIGSLISGIVAPIIGRRLDSHGGRGVMATGSAVAAIALLAVAVAREPIVFTLGWMLAGVAMAACLYDSAFASLYQMAPERYRRAVTGLTLFGGFASTIFWPLTNILATRWGWREALLFFALLHVLVCIPIHLKVLPGQGSHASHGDAAAADASRPYLADRRFYWLAASFAAATMVFSALSAFMIAALGARGFSVTEAVWIAALIGPMQVLARVVEWIFAGRFSAVAVGIAACALSVFAMLLLTVIPDALAFGVLFAVCYGAANGVITIVKGTVPVELFGPQRQGALLGALARPSFLTKALAPALFAAALSLGVSMQVGLYALALVSTTSFVCFVLAGRGRAAELAAPRTASHG